MFTLVWYKAWPAPKISAVLTPKMSIQVVFSYFLFIFLFIFSFSHFKIEHFIWEVPTKWYKLYTEILQDILTIHQIIYSTVKIKVWWEETGTCYITMNTRCSVNVGTMLAQRLRRWTNIVSALAERLVFSRIPDHRFRWLINGGTYSQLTSVNENSRW